MKKDNIDVVVALAQSAVESHAVEPVSQIGLRNTAIKHTLEIYGEIECYGIGICRINEHNGLIPCCLIIHFSFLFLWCEDNTFFSDGKTICKSYDRTTKVVCLTTKKRSKASRLYSLIFLCG